MSANQFKKDEFNDLIKKQDINGKEISRAMASNMKYTKINFLAKDNASDLVYFVEDDYIQEHNNKCFYL